MVVPACRGTSEISSTGVQVQVTVNRDGSADIREQLELAVPTGADGALRFPLPEFRNDGVSGVVVTLDGVPTGSTALQVPTGSHVLVRTYRAKNVVWISGIRGTVLWRALPADRNFHIAAASIAIALPDDAVLLDDPWTDEAGWTVKRLPHGMTAERTTAFADGETGTAGVEFTIDRMIPARPQWQIDADMAEEFIPAFVSAGLFIVVVGVGILFMLRVRFAASAPESAAPVRIAAARDLTITGWVVVGAGIVGAAFVHFALRRFGIWPMAIPASLLLVGVMFLVAGTRMLYFARVRDGRISV